MDSVVHTHKEWESFKATKRFKAWIANVGEVYIDFSLPVKVFTVDNSISTALLLHKQRFNIPPLFAYRGNKYVSPVMEDRLKRGLLTSADLDRYYVDSINLQLTVIFKCRIFCFGHISSVIERFSLRQSECFLCPRMRWNLLREKAP